MRKVIPAVAVVLLALSPGAAADPFPRGCVDCHVERPDLGKDFRISTLMRGWQEGVSPELLAKVRAFSPPAVTVNGKHPKVDAASAEVPTSCLKCHARAPRTAPPFATLLHGLHLAEKSHFVELFGGQCTHCHALDPATGVMGLKRGAETK